MGAIMSKVGKAVASQSKWVVKTIPKENRELAEHLFPFRFTKAGVVGVGGITAAYGIGTTALNEHKARQIGRIEATPVAKIIAIIPSALASPEKLDTPLLSIGSI